jgi:hypothetical protein
MCSLSGDTQSSGSASWFYKTTKPYPEYPAPLQWYYTFVSSGSPNRGLNNPWFAGISHPIEPVFPDFNWKPGGAEKLSGCQVLYAKKAIAKACPPDVFVSVKAKYAILVVDCRSRTFVDVTLAVADPIDYSRWEAVSIGSCPPGTTDDIATEPYWYPAIVCPP